MLQPFPHRKKKRATLRPSQRERFCAYLSTRVATAAMTSTATRIPHKNICRLKRQLEKEGRLWEVWKDTCKRTGARAAYLTTNFKFVPLNPQYTTAA